MYRKSDEDAPEESLWKPFDRTGNASDSLERMVMSNGQQEVMSNGIAVSESDVTQSQTGLDAEWEKDMETVEIDEPDLVDYLGRPRFIPESAERTAYPRRSKNQATNSTMRSSLSTIRMRLRGPS